MSTDVEAWMVRPMRALVDLADKDVVYDILDRADRVAEPKTP